MATVFGKGLRAKRKADNEDEVTPIADEANEWWTRRDFVQEPVVRSRESAAQRSRMSSPGPQTHGTDAGPTSGTASAPFAATFSSEPFAATFSADSLFERIDEPRPAATAPPADAPTATPNRPRVAINHPLFPALVHLGLDTTATWSDVQHAYRRMAKVTHPDRTGDDGIVMAELNQAYRALSDGRRYGFFGDD